MRRVDRGLDLSAREDGTVLLRGAAEALWLGWIGYLRALLGANAGSIVHVPGLVQERVLTAAKYVDHFPQQVFRVRALEADTEVGLALPPSCCLHLFADRAGTRLGPEGMTAVVYGSCARFEGGRWAGARLSHFTMLEWVALGEAELLSGLDERVPALVSGAFQALGFQFEVVEANDPFFGGDASGPAVFQRITRAKEEWRNADGLAVGSVNRHSDAFGQRFNIQAGERPAHSMCVAFGIERLVSESLATWGEVIENWPAEFSRHVSLP